MKKSIKWGLGVGVLVLLAGAGIASQQAQKTTTKPAETATKEASQADKDSYEKALAAIKTAEESLSEADFATAEKLVKEATYRKSVLKGKLNTLQVNLPWRELKSLIATAQANPTDEALKAVQNELAALQNNSTAMEYHRKSIYTDQVHELQLKQAETYIAKAEETTTQEDYTTANNLYNSLVDLYNNSLSTWQQWSSDHGEVLDTLLARLNAIQVGSKIAPAPQEQQQAQAAATEPEQYAQEVYTAEEAGQSDYTESVEPSYSTPAYTQSKEQLLREIAENMRRDRELAAQIPGFEHVNDPQYQTNIDVDPEDILNSIGQ